MIVLCEEISIALIFQRIVLYEKWIISFRIDNRFSDFYFLFYLFSDITVSTLLRTGSVLAGLELGRTRLHPLSAYN